MAMSQQDILNFVRDGLADLRGQKQEDSKPKPADYATAAAEQDTNASGDLDFFDSAWLTSEQQTTDTDYLAPPPPPLPASPPAPPQPELLIPAMPPLGIMPQTNLINAISQYRSRSEYYAARQVCNLGYSMFGQDAFDRALEMAGIKNIPHQDKQMSGNPMALEALVLVWEEMVCLGGPEHVALVKGVIEGLHGEGALKDEEKKWNGGMKVEL
ncbi:hypothetical protein AC578_634 [Pseudocercospora eumusae]|uniref:Uncharacterized protein n=1 Tax=Pseudocercospora eumusae TaxID=321146 RepID=A0A139GUG0_9PEZI|nr:hypothetical protein AC578_634 [Pseudocercospora eumusae]